jgi:3-methyl-2-oxobutanoate hydroxymethyltransferase
VLVLHDILNLTFAPPAKFVRRYGDAADLILNAVKAFKHDVERWAYPADEESYHLPKEARPTLEGVLSRKHAVGSRREVV